MPRSFPFAVSEGSPPLTLGTLLQYKDKESEEAQRKHAHGTSKLEKELLSKNEEPE